MSGGNTVVGLWRDKVEPQNVAGDDGDGVAGSKMHFDEYAIEHDASRSGNLRTWVVGGIAALASLSWLGALAWEFYSQPGSGKPSLGEIVNLIGTASAPLALIAVIWLIAQRSGTAEQARFAKTSAVIDTQALRLETIFALMNQRIIGARKELEEQGERLMSFGNDAASRLNGVSRSLNGEVETICRHTQQLTSSAATARGDLAVLLASLPKANVQTRQLAASLQDLGLSAHEHAGALDAQLSLLTVRGKEADDVASGAAQRLAAHLARMESVGEVAGARLEAAAGQMTESVDAALERSAEALDAARQGMEAQGHAMMALVEQSQTAMIKAGDEAAATLRDRVGEIGARVDEITSSFAAQDERAANLVARLQEDLHGIEAGFSEFNVSGTERIARLGMAIQALRDHAGDMTTALAGSGENASHLATRVESLLTAIDAATREVDETLPAAFARLEFRSTASLSVLEKSVPALQAVIDTASTTLAEFDGLAERIAAERAGVEGLTALGVANLADYKTTALDLAGHVQIAVTEAERLAIDVVPQLESALSAIRNSTETMGQATRDMLNGAVADATQDLSERSRLALSEALSTQVETQLTEIGKTTERAVASAQQATERLMRQMLTISETTSSIEARVADAKEEIERNDHGNFARRVALLIESLNSTAIDVTKILSNEVTDTAWAAYLRGDRGVFSRRAVRLLDTAQAREIAHNYEHDSEFREQVNRYIHDFEGMLRNVLATRDGSMLGVTLLSSDNGKLYVALAQAIERLRG